MGSDDRRNLEADWREKVTRMIQRNYDKEKKRERGENSGNATRIDKYKWREPTTRVGGDSEIPERLRGCSVLDGRSERYFCLAVENLKTLRTQIPKT